MSKKFIFIVWNYTHHGLLLDYKENYFLTSLDWAVKAGLDVYLLIKSGREYFEQDYRFNNRVNIVDYKNFFYFLFSIIKFSFLKATFYINGCIPPFFVIPFIARRTVFMAHCSPVRRSRLKQFAQNFLYMYFKRIRAVNYAEKQFLIKQGVPADKIFIIPLPISDIFIKRVSSSDRTDLVYFGQVTPIKDVPTILRALNEVIKFYPKIKLFVLGDIIDPLFTPTIKQLGLESRVVVLGFSKQDNSLSEFLNCRLVAVNSSLSEGQCLSVYGAAMCGCLLCLPDIMSFNVQFKKFALFHELGNYQKLADNIRACLENRNFFESYNNECRKMIRSFCDFSSIERDFINIIKFDY